MLGYPKTSEKTREFDLILFTDSYPFGLDEPFLASELELIAARFRRILVVPFFSSRDVEVRALPDNATLAEPLWQPGAGMVRKLMRGGVNRAPLLLHLKEIFNQKAFRNLPLWSYSVMVTRHLCSHPWLKTMLADNPEAILYFYWGYNAAWMIPTIRRRNRSIKIVTRFHGGDLYANRKDLAGYLPLHQEILSCSTKAVFVSDHGIRYALELMPSLHSKSTVFRLGVKSQGEGGASSDGIFRIVSCSRIATVKRIHIIVAALSQLDFPVEWIHIGDGPQRFEIDRLLHGLPDHVKVRFHGKIDNRDVTSFYATHPVDLFVNVSESEGVPVSIMEALAAGIPVLATAVGGTPEIVDEKVGKLLSVDLNGRLLADEISTFRQRSLLVNKELRRAAKQRWSEFADAGKVYDRFVTSLVALARQERN